jgi:hypothetical protein
VRFGDSTATDRCAGFGCDAAIDDTLTGSGCLAPFGAFFSTFMSAASPIEHTASANNANTKRFLFG